jgi:hypothetical protein
MSPSGQPMSPSGPPMSPLTQSPTLTGTSAAAANPFGGSPVGMGGTSQPGAQAISQGYATGYQNLLAALAASQNTQSGQQAMLGNQLQNNLGNVQQGLTNSGLANSTIMQSMKQAPLQTYNLGMLNSQNQGNLINMGAYQNLANMAAAGGQALGGYYSPFGQAQAAYNQQHSGQIQQLNPGGGGALTQNPYAALMAQLQAGQGGQMITGTNQYYGGQAPIVAGDGAPTASTPAAATPSQPNVANYAALSAFGGGMMQNVGGYGAAGSY